MSNNVRKISIFLLLSILFGCNHPSKKRSGLSFLQESQKKIGTEEYNNIYKQTTDSLINWLKYDLYNINKYGYIYKIDSLLCFNTSGTRFIGAELHFLGNQNSKFSDGIHYFYGEKIDGNWYFWRGGYIVIPREIYPKHDPTQPLSYSQLHEQALKEVFGGYLTKDGQINEEWFAHHFEKGGRFSFEDRYKYKWILDGERIDNYDEWYKYTRKRTGLGLWIGKMTRDSINRVNQILKPDHITREEENEITMYFSKKLVNGK